MARDIDGIRIKKRVSRQTAIYRSGKKATWLAILVVLLVTGGASYFYYQSLSVTPTTASSTTDNAVTTPSIDPTNENGSVLTNNITTINIYDSGAGNEATLAVTAKLETAGYSTKSLAQSQLIYDKTYIWYRPEFVDDAQKIKDVLNDREVVISPIHITGSFDLLIYLGKK